MGRNNRTDRGSRRSSGTGESIPARQILDRFTSVDDLLEDTNEQLSDVATINRELEKAVASLTDAELELPSRNELPLVANTVVEPETTDDLDVETESTAKVTLPIPRDGAVTQASLSFPSGANQSLGIGIRGIDGEKLVPFGPSGVQYIALSDVVQDFSLDYSVNKNDEIEVRFINNRVAETEEDIEELSAYLSTIVVVAEGA